MATRSWLFVPGDSERKLAKAAAAGADAVIVDLEDAVSLENKPGARKLAGDWLAAPAEADFARWVRINPLDGHLWREDLAEVMRGRPAGVMVPKASGAEQLRSLAAELYEQEARHGIPHGTTRMLPLVSETAAAALSIPAYVGAPLPRLAGLTWGAEDLSTVLGALRKRDGRGMWADTFRFVRAQVLLTAHACGVMAVDTLYSDFRDTAGLKRVAADSFADGFTGMLAIHPGQVPIINAAFTPSAEAIERAQAIVDAFAASPGAGALSLDGDMIDQPHLAAAQRLLEQAK